MGGVWGGVQGMRVGVEAVEDPIVIVMARLCSVEVAVKSLFLDEGVLLYRV